MPKYESRWTSCNCPKRLAFGTVDSLIEKLRSIFADNGKGVEWHSLLGVGNPVSCRSLKLYLADVREEKLRARFTPRQAEPILVGDLAVISEYIQNQLKVCGGGGGGVTRNPNFCACQRSGAL